MYFLSNKIKKIVSILFRIGISIVLLHYLFHQVDKKSLLEIIKQANGWVLFLAGTVFSINYTLAFLRWKTILETLGVKITWKRLLAPFSGGIFFNLFLPTIGGDFVRSVVLAVHTNKTKEVLASVFLDRISGYIGLVVLTLVALSFGWGLIQDQSVLIAISIISGLLVVILFVIFSNCIFSKVNKFLLSLSAGRIKEVLKDLHEEIYYFRDNKRVIIYIILISIVVQAISPVAFYVISLSMGLNVNILYFFVFLPIIGAITLLPISIGGLGVRDMSIVFIFANVGVPKDIALAMSLLHFFFIVVFAGVGGIIYLFSVSNGAPRLAGRFIRE